MADFKTHVTVAAVLSTTLATGAFVMGVATLNEMVLYALTGTLGGLLPDIDADLQQHLRCQSLNVRP